MGISLDVIKFHTAIPSSFSLSHLRYCGALLFFPSTAQYNLELKAFIKLASLHIETVLHCSEAFSSTPTFSACTGFPGCVWFWLPSISGPDQKKKSFQQYWSHTAFKRVLEIVIQKGLS